MYVRYTDIYKLGSEKKLRVYFQLVVDKLER